MNLATSMLLLVSTILQSGIYAASEGASPDLCPHEVRAYTWDDVLTGLDVTYVGDCFADGPYTYGCEDDLCGGPGIEIEILGETRYRWTNTVYGFSGVFELRK